MNLFPAVCLLASCAAAPEAAPEIPMQKLTPVLFVESIEPCLPLWHALGFQTLAEVPGEDGSLGFAMLESEGRVVMYQSHASVRADLPALAEEAAGSFTFLFVQVDDLDALKPALEGVEIVVPERETFYGFRELGIRDAAGNVITLAQPLAPSSTDGS
ncbi:MAG: hypothetical protein O2816_11120 [Planctomycetota bacterium]|nr:hypothetical protein [Planctomycetota bacterium]